MNSFVRIEVATCEEEEDTSFPVEQAIIIVVRDEDLRQLVFMVEILLGEFNHHTLGD